MAELERFQIAARFCGPPDSGNGGYVAGRLAQHIDGPAVVRLHIPPPLNRDLSVIPTDDGVELRDGDTRVASALSGPVELPPPPAPSPKQAEAAASRFRGFDVHPFTGCFVCGTDRRERDGLRIFAGPLEDTDRVACTWIPDDTLAGTAGSDGREGRVAPEFVWAALDCPGAFAFPQIDGVCLLGELAVDLIAAPRVGEPTTLVGWQVRHEGRKHVTGTALYDAERTCLSVAAATWIELPNSSIG